jgi:hypothetical protein
VLIVEGYYDVGPYFFTKSVVDLPFMLLVTIIFSVLVMPLAGLQYKDEKFGPTFKFFPFDPSQGSSSSSLRYC